MPRPPIHSFAQFTDFTDECLAIARRLLHLSRKHPDVAALDRHMVDCWNNSLCGHTPTPQQRSACRLNQTSAAALRPLLLPAISELSSTLQSLDAYFTALPLPHGDAPPAPMTCHNPQCRAPSSPDARYCPRCGAALPPRLPATGWRTPQPLLHPDSVIKPLGAAIKDASCLHHLEPTDSLPKSLHEQLLKLARWTRESIHPTYEQRQSARLATFTEPHLLHSLDRALANAVDSLHYFHELYVNFPER